MSIGFNADEVLTMAVQIETNGAAFYRRAAELQADSEHCQFLSGLATMEEQHKQTFLRLRETLNARESEALAFDPDDEAALYLAAAADGHGGEGSPTAADALTGSESMADILRIALGLENKSILYYIGLRDMVPPRSGRDKVEEIIREEQRHVAQLTRVLSRL